MKHKHGRKVFLNLFALLVMLLLAGTVALATGESGGYVYWAASAYNNYDSYATLVVDVKWEDGNNQHHSRPEQAQIEIWRGAEILERLQETGSPNEPIEDELYGNIQVDPENKQYSMTGPGLYRMRTYSPRKPSNKMAIYTCGYTNIVEELKRYISYYDLCDLEYLTYNVRPQEVNGYDITVTPIEINSNKTLGDDSDLYHYEVVYRFKKSYSVLYQDGLENTVFSPQETMKNTSGENLKINDPTPGFAAEEGKTEEKDGKIIPKRPGYAFEGWKLITGAGKDTDEPGGVRNTIQSSQADGEGKIIYEAVWVPLYTVTYTDGVDDEEVFADQVTDNLKKGVDTPSFDGTPTRGLDLQGLEPCGLTHSNGNRDLYSPVGGERNPAGNPPRYL